MVRRGLSIQMAFTVVWREHILQALIGWEVMA